MQALRTVLFPCCAAFSEENSHNFREKDLHCGGKRGIIALFISPVDGKEAAKASLKRAAGRCKAAEDGAFPLPEGRRR